LVTASGLVTLLTNFSLADAFVAMLQTSQFRFLGLQPGGVAPGFRPLGVATPAERKRDVASNLTAEGCNVPLISLGAADKRK